jgi:hypothetical protein
MSETTLHPSSSRRTDTVVAEPVADVSAALRMLGWIQPIDYLMMVLVCLCWLTILAWHIFGHPTPWNILSCVLVAGCLTQMWTILLVFRCAHFVLLIQAYLNTLPDEAARIVMAAYSGQGIQRPQSKNQV